MALLLVKTKNNNRIIPYNQSDKAIQRLEQIKQCLQNLNALIFRVIKRGQLQQGNIINLYPYRITEPMLIELDNIVQCLRGLQQQDSADFEDQLTEICINPSALLNFKVILADPQIQQSTKKMAAVFFKNYFIERYSDFQEVFFVQLVMSMVLDPKLPYKYKIIIEQTIISMLEWIEKQNLQQVIDCIQAAFSCLQKASGKQVLTLEKKSIKINRNLDPTRLNLKKYCNFQISTEQDFLNLSYSIVHFVECFTSVSTLDAEDLHRVVRISLAISLTIFPMKNSQQHLRLQMVVLHMWLGYIELAESQKENKNDLGVIEQQIFEQKHLWEKILQVYEFTSYNFVPLQNQDILFVCSPQQPHKKIINKMKSYACQIHLKLLTYESQQTQILDVLNKTISPIMFSRSIKTLSYFSLQKSKIQSACCEQFINSLLSLFIYISQQSPQIIDSNWANLLHMIIFPILTMDEKEFLSFDQQPEEFCRLAEDCCDKQNLGQIKTQAARFLQVVCDRNFTYCQYVIQYCCVSLQTVILKNQSNIDTSKTLLLSLQASFMILSILSYNLARFQFEKSSIQKILLSPQCLQLTQIEASRIFLFLSYNYSQIFLNPLQGTVWINYAMNGSMHYTTKKAAFDFILNTVEEYFEEGFLVDFSAKLNSQVQIRQVWSIINKLLNNHLQKVSQKTMLKLIQNILERMSSQITKYKNRQIKSTQNVSSGLEILRKILSNHKYTKNKPQVLAQIYKVIPLYKTFKQLHLQDVILKIINEFMDRQDKISEIFDNMLPQLIQEFRQQGYRPTAFFWIWNQYVFKSQSFEKVREIKNQLLEGLKLFYQSFITQKRRTQNNLPIAHTFLILQHILMTHGQKLNKQQIFEIYQLSKIFLPQDMDEPERVNLSPTIIGRALIVMLICHMLRKSQQSDKGQKTDALKYLLLYHDEEDVFTGQNAQVLIKLLCKQLFRQSDPVSVTQMINIMVRVLRPSPKDISHHTKSKKSKNSLHFKIKSKQNFQMILKKIKSPFDLKTHGEQQLKNSLTTMKQNNELLYKSIISYLPTQIKQKLRDLLATNTFVSTETQRVRKIFKIGGAKKGETKQNQDQSLLKNSRKRVGNFDAQQQGQIYEQIDENQLVLENDKEQNDDTDDLKGKMKRNKFMKKLKKNEKQNGEFNQHQ